MSNNDLYCNKCNSQHHPADICPMDIEKSKNRKNVDWYMLTAIIIFFVFYSWFWYRISEILITK